MFRDFKNRKRSASSHMSIVTAALLTFLTAHMCDAFPVDFVLTALGQRKQSAPQVEEAKEAPADAKAAAADVKVAEAVPKADVKAAPEPRKGVVRRQVAVGAAAAAAEVGQVLGDLIGGLFGRREAQPGAIVIGRREAQLGVIVKLDNNALKQFEAQYGRHFDQMIRTELHFVRIVCQPTRQQYDAMATDGKLIRTKAINKFAMLKQGRNRGVRSSNDSDTRKPISEGLLASANRHLSADQVAAYQRELAARKDAAKEVAILITAAKVDRKLVLNGQQRAQVTKVLAENWNPAWGGTQMMRHGGQYFPDVPDPKITPILTATQKKVLRTVNQQSRVFFGFNVGMIQGIVIADEKWDDQPENEASKKTDATDKKTNDEKPSDGDSVEAIDVKKTTSVLEDSE
jgi:hypothetical protein